MVLNASFPFPFSHLLLISVGFIFIRFSTCTLLKLSRVCESEEEMPYYLLVCFTFKVFFSSPSLPVLDLMSKLSKNRYVHHSTKCCIFSRSEASVIVRDMCLADGAISARMDSMTCESGIPRAAAHATVIPLGR